MPDDVVGEARDIIKTSGVYRYDRGGERNVKGGGGPWKSPG